MADQNVGLHISPYTDEMGDWVIWLTQFSLGVDGLGLMIWMKDRQAAPIGIPLLLVWQAAVFVYFFRWFLPRYRSLEREHPEFCRIFMQLFRLAMGLPIIVTIAAWTTLSVLTRAPH